MDDNDGQMIFGDLGDLKLPDICLTGEEKPRKKPVRKNPEKNLTQETYPDRGSNPGPLHDRRACYHLAHSGGLVVLDLKAVLMPYLLPIFLNFSDMPGAYGIITGSVGFSSAV